MFCSDINFGPEPVGNEHILWQMGESEELKDCRGTFARQQTAVTPPGVWRQRKMRGERVSQEEPIAAVLLETFDGLCWWQMHPWSITPLHWGLKYILNWLGSIQTRRRRRLNQASFQHHLTATSSATSSDNPVLISGTEMICLRSLMTELSEICLSGKFWATNSFRLLEIGSSPDNQAAGLYG